MTSSSEPVARPQIIAAPYEADPRTGPQRGRGLMFLAGVAAFCLIYGFAFALLAPRLLLPVIAPLPVMAIAAIWALPEIRAVPTRTLTILTFAFFLGLVLWPNYIAIALPGLPWITIVRLTGFPLVLTLLICVSVSATFRSRLATALSAAPLLWRALVVFVVIQFVSIGFSHQLGFSIDKFVVAQVSWTAMFFLCSYVFLHPGRVERMAAMLWAMTIPVGIIGIFEWKAQAVLWAGHIPSFLQIDDPSVIEALSSRFRAGGEAYRTHSTFINSLGLGEYLALTLPFIIQFVMGRYGWFTRAAAMVSIPFVLFIVYITGSRLSVVGCLLSFMFYAVAWTILYWREKRDSILAPAFLLALPIGLATMMGLILFWKKLHDLALGGSSGTTSSTAARQEQLAMAIPKFLSHPWGYGIGNAAQTVGFKISNGNITLDSYFITVAIEYGIQGFIVFYGMIAVGIYCAGKYTVKSIGMSREYTMLVPLAIALANFFIIKTVFSQQDNHAIVFMFLGMIVALGSRIRNQAAKDVATVRAAAATTALSRPRRVTLKR